MSKWAVQLGYCSVVVCGTSGGVAGDRDQPFDFLGRLLSSQLASITSAHLGYKITSHATPLVFTLGVNHLRLFV